MPNPKGAKAVVLYKEIAERLSAKYEITMIEKTGQEARGYSFQAYVNDIIKDRLDKDDMLQERFPHLHKIAIQDNIIYIKDSDSDHEFDTFSVYYQQDKLFCNEDESTECKHVQYAWALPELAKVARPKSGGKKR